MHPSCPVMGPDVVDGVSEVSGAAVVIRDVGVVGVLDGGGRRWACTNTTKKQATIEICFTHIFTTEFLQLYSSCSNQCFYTEIINLRSQARSDTVGFRYTETLQ